MAHRFSGRAIALLPVLTLAVSVAGCAEDVDPGGDTEAGEEISLINEGELTTCTNLPYEPFEFVEDGETVGFDIALIDLVAEELDVEQNVFDTSFEGIESGASFDSGQCDVAAAAMTITDERAEAMDFSDGYFDANQALLVLKDSGIEGIDQLEDKVLGVQQGTTGEEYAEEHQDEYGYEIRQYEDLGLMETAVQTEQVDAGINDNTVLYEFADENDEVETTEEFDTGEEYGIAVRKGDGALLEKINEVLKAAKDDGRYDEIYEEWFGQKPEDT